MNKYCIKILKILVPCIEKYGNCGNVIKHPFSIYYYCINKETRLYFGKNIRCILFNEKWILFQGKSAPKVLQCCLTSTGMLK